MNEKLWIQFLHIGYRSKENKVEREWKDKAKEEEENKKEKARRLRELRSMGVSHRRNKNNPDKRRLKVYLEKEEQAYRTMWKRELRTKGDCQEE